MFRRLFSSRQRIKPRNRRLFLRGLEHLEPRIVLDAGGLSIVLDYSLDTNNFFNDQTRKDTLQRAATVLESRITDELGPITPSGSNTWDATFTHPGTGASHEIHNQTIPLGTIIIFVGGRNIGNLGVGGPGGYAAVGSPSFLATISNRGQTGIDSDNGNNSTDFAPWGGHITFDSSTTWNFGDDEPSAGENDFYSVALHEIGHVLGVGTADSWNNLVNESNLFTGPVSAAANGGNVSLASGSSHWVNGLESTLINTGAVQESAMDPNLTVGTRKQFTVLDWAALSDVGWEIADTFAPTIDIISNINVDEDGPEIQVNLTGISAGGTEIQPLSVSIASDNTSLTGTPTVTYTSNETTGTIKFTPLPNQSGTATITVTVTDGGLDGNLATLGDNATVSTVFDANVSAVNDIPTINTVDDLELIQNATQQVVQLSGITAGGGETQPLKVTATSSNPSLLANPVVSYASDNTTGSISFSPLASQSGNSTITVSVTDAGLDGDLATGADNATTVVTFNVTVNPVNDPPTIDAIPNLGLLEDAATQAVSLSGITAGASEIQPLEITATSDNPSLIPDPVVSYASDNTTGSISFSPLPTQSGNSTITVLVTDAGLDGDITTDDDNSTTQITFNITVNPVNDPPTIDTISNLGLLEDAATQIVSLSGITAGTSETQPLEVTATSDNPSLIPNPNVIYESDNTTGSLSFTPLSDQFGSATITVTVTDGGLDGNLVTLGDNETTITVFDVVVSPINDNPTINAFADLELVENATQQLVQLAGISAGGGESQELLITATSSNSALLANPAVNYTSDNATGTITFQPVANTGGQTTITLTVFDAGLDGNIATSADNGMTLTSFNVTINNTNAVPTINSISDVTTVEDGDTQQIILTGITAGPNETQPLQITTSSSNATLIADPLVTYISDQTTGILIFTPLTNQSGNATITVQVTDGGLDGNLGTSNDNASKTTVFEITVTAVNDDPTIDALSDLTVSEDAPLQTVSLSGISAGGGESQPLAVTALSNNTALIGQPILSYATPDSTGTLEFTPVANLSGTATITVTVTDGGLDANLATTDDNGVATESFDIEVSAINDPPTIDPVADVTVTEDSATFTVDLTGITAGLGETQPLSITLENDSTDLFSSVTLDYLSDESTGTIHLTPANSTSGTATFTLTVTDGGLDNDLATTADNESVTEAFDVSITPAFPWHNYDLPLDVNGDNATSPIDVLLIIQELNRNGSYELPTPRSRLEPPFYDVDRDGWITPSDALQIINYLNFNEHQVSFNFDVTDLNGSPIASVETGSFFLVGLYAEDLSPVPNGVYSAYIDMVYDSNLMRIVSGPSFLSPFVNGQSGITTEPGIIDEWGAFAGIQPTGSGRQLVSTVQFLATAAGSSLVGSGRADISPLHDVHVYGSNNTVIPELIGFGSLTISITDSEAEGEDPWEPPYATELEGTLDLLLGK